MSSQADLDLTKYQKALRFPPDLEEQFLHDYSQRNASAFLEFFTLGTFLYLAFGILDYWALWITYPLAWRLRLLGAVFLVAGMVGIKTDIFGRNIKLYGPAWCFFPGLTIVAMIFLAQPQEPGYSLYAYGLMLIMVAIYITGAVSLAYSSLFGWLLTVVYALIAIFHQNVLNAYETSLMFFVAIFFHIGMNVLGMMSGAYLGRAYRRDFLQRRVIEVQRATEELLRDQAERLLHNILSGPVAERLQRGEKVADHFGDVSILFADIVDFTPFTASLNPDELVETLNNIFSYFDELADRYGLEKIKTIGDCYMVAAGVPKPFPGHAEALVQLGLDMTGFFNHNQFVGHRLGLRVGVNSGPVVGGVIGRRKIFYDLWGDVVNTASRMESHGRSGVVQITHNTYELVKDKFDCIAQGEILVKGKGLMPVWHVMGPK